MLYFFLRLHLAIKAWIVKRLRTREVLRAYRVAHAEELRSVSFQDLPLTIARQQLEVESIKAGKLQIVERKSWAWPYLPATVNRLSTPLAKSIPYNLRRMSRTPVPRRAINLIKGAVTALPFEIRKIDGVSLDDEDQLEQQDRIDIGLKILKHPNNDDSFQTWLELMIEDLCCLGASASELAMTLDVERPLKSWAANVESIRIFAAWSEGTPDMPRYAQMTGLKGERGAVLFWDDEMMYIRDNISTDSPFGLGKMEVAFSSVNSILGVQDMAGRAGTDVVHRTWLWWDQPQPDSGFQAVRRSIQNDLEGQAKVAMIAGMKKPDVVEITPVAEQDLLLNWQEMLIRMIANAFDLSAMSLGIEHDVNRAVGSVLNDKDFRSAVVPMAKRIQEAITRKIFHQLLGWYDLEFVFLNLEDPDMETKMDMCSRMYSANAITPNQIRKAMNLQPLDTPYADLTQFEAMMVNLEAASRIQIEQQKELMQMQQSMSEQEPPPDNDDGGPSTPDTDQLPSKPSMPMAPPQPQGKPGAPPPGSKQPQAPAPLKLPQFPISGTQYTSQDIAMMPVEKIQQLWEFGRLPKIKRLLTDMENQDPMILEQMSDQLRDFFERALEEEEKENEPKPIPNQLVKKMKQRQQKIWNKQQNKRTTDMQEFQKQQYFKNHLPGSPGKPGGAPRKPRAMGDFI